MAITKTTKALDDAKAFENFLPEARTLTRAIPLRADAALAQKNVARGVEAVMRYRVKIRRELPSVDVDSLRTLPELARATVYAAHEVERAAPPKTNLREQLKRARELRELMLSSAESLAAAGIFPASDVAKIRSGLGPIDSARDCVALAELFRENLQAVKGKTPVDRRAIDEAAHLGAELLTRLKPTGGARVRGSLADLVASRDKLWTLLLRRHELLWKVGAYLFGHEVERRVPPLQSKGGTRKLA